MCLENQNDITLGRRSNQYEIHTFLTSTPKEISRKKLFLKTFNIGCFSWFGFYRKVLHGVFLNFYKAHRYMIFFLISSPRTSRTRLHSSHWSRWSWIGTPKFPGRHDNTLIIAEAWSSGCSHYSYIASFLFFFLMYFWHCNQEILMLVSQTSIIFRLGMKHHKKILIVCQLAISAHELWIKIKQYPNVHNHSPQLATCCSSHFPWRCAGLYFVTNKLAALLKICWIQIRIQVFHLDSWNEWMTHRFQIFWHKYRALLVDLWVVP